MRRTWLACLVSLVACLGLRPTPRVVAQSGGAGHAEGVPGVEVFDPDYLAERRVLRDLRFVEVFASDVIAKVLEPLTVHSKAEELVHVADGAMRRRDFPGAIARLDEAIRLDPLCARAYRTRGVARHDMGDLVAAVADYDEAARLDPSDGYALYYRGLAYAYGGDNWSAIDAYSEAITRAPELASPYIARGQARLALRDACAAQADARLGLDLSDGEENAEAMRLWMNAAEKAGDHTPLLAWIDQLISFDPDDPALHAKRAELLAGTPDAKLRDPAAALASAQRAEKLGKGRSRAALRALAVAHASAGDFPRALRCSFRAAFREIPNPDMGTDVINVVTCLVRRAPRMVVWTGEPWKREMPRLLLRAGVSSRCGYYLGLDLDRGFTARAAMSPALPVPFVVVRWNPKGLRELHGRWTDR